MVKTDSLGNNHSVNLTSPAGRELLYSFYDYEITWFSNEVDYVNIDYSVDKGINWENIVSYYPAELKSLNDTFSIGEEALPICIISALLVFTKPALETRMAPKTIPMISNDMVPKIFLPFISSFLFYKIFRDLIPPKSGL